MKIALDETRLNRLRLEKYRRAFNLPQRFFARDVTRRRDYLLACLSPSNLAQQEGRVNLTEVESKYASVTSITAFLIQHSESGMSDRRKVVKDVKKPEHWVVCPVCGGSTFLDHKVVSSFCSFCENGFEQFTCNQCQGKGCENCEMTGRSVIPCRVCRSQPKTYQAIFGSRVCPYCQGSGVVFRLGRYNPVLKRSDVYRRESYVSTICK